MHTQLFYNLLKGFKTRLIHINKYLLFSLQYLPNIFGKVKNSPQNIEVYRQLVV